MPNGEPVVAKESAAASPPILERWGVRYFRNLSRDVKVVDVDGVNYLNPEERKALATVARGAIVRAGVAGTLSTVVSATAEVLANPLIASSGGAPAPWSMTLRFWLIVLGATTLASIIEIAYLYWDGLRAVHRMAVVAGLDLFGEVSSEAGPTDDERAAVAAGLARAALELPNPAGHVFGVNPHRHASRLQLVLASLVYKLKISVTSFLVKALVRRALGRTALRGWLDALVPFAAVPVTAAWNAIVAWLVLREARIRTMGPSAAAELTGIVLDDAGALSEPCRQTLFRAVASSMVRTEDLHPNLVALLAHVAKRLDLVAIVESDHLDLGDPARFLSALRDLDDEERKLCLRMLCVAAILDGRVTRKERALIEQAFAMSGLAPKQGVLSSLRRSFVRGDKIPKERVLSLA